MPNIGNSIIYAMANKAEQSDDLFLKDLYEISSNEKTVEMSVASNYDYNDNDENTLNSKNNPDLKFNTPYDYNTNDKPSEQAALERFGFPTGKTFNGNTGRTLIPGNSSQTGQNSTNENIQVIINANGSMKHRAVGAAHEFGHVILYLRGLPHMHNKKGVDSFIDQRTKPIIKRLGYDF